MTKTYTLTITEEQARVLQTATELYARISSGDIGDAIGNLPIKWNTINYDEYHEDVNTIRTLIRKYTIGNVDGYKTKLGVGSSDKVPGSDISWDLYQVIRHKLSWVCAVERDMVENEDALRNWDKMMQVCYDEPRRCGSEELAKMENVKND